MANFSLLAKFGVDTRSLENGLKKAETHVSGFKRSMSKVGAVIGRIGPAIAGIGFAAMTKHVIDSAKEIKNLSVLAGENIEDFQRMAHASKTVGISQEKLADILKDVNDKIGDFMQTGAGPMVDFFEQIAPKVGVTADQFKKLSGRDALQLYVDSLEKANLSQSDMTFYMEAIASDATALLPLLKESGKEFEKIGDSLKSPMTAEEAEKMAKAADILDKLKTKATNFGAKALVGTFNSFTDMRPHIAKAQLKQEGAFRTDNGTGPLKDRKERKRLLDERVALNAALAAADAKADKEKEDKAKASAAVEAKIEREKRNVAKASAEELAKVKSGKAYKEKTPEEIREEHLGGLKDRIKEVQLEQLHAQAKGDNEAAEALKYRVELMERTLDLMNKFNIGTKEAAKIAATDLLKVRKEKKEKQDKDEETTNRETLEKKLQQIEMARTRAQALGDQAAEASLTRRVHLAEEVLRLMGEGFNQIEATKLANDLTTSGKPADTRGDFSRDLSGDDLRRASNKAADKGTHFGRMADGTFQKFVNGSKKGRFTEAQMQAGLEKRIEKDPTQKTLKRIESILEGKFVNE